MSRHATIGNSNVGHKNTTLKQANKYYGQIRVARAADLASDVHVETFEPLPALDIERTNPFTGINPINGQDFTKVGNNAYKLRVREGFVGLTRVTVKPQDGKAFGVWVASYAGRKLPLLTNKGQALDFKGAKDKLFQLLITNMQVTPVRHVTPADKRVKAEKTYTGGDVSRFAIYAERAGRKIRYMVPENMTPGQIVDDMELKGYKIVRIANV